MTIIDVINGGGLPLRYTELAKDVIAQPTELDHWPFGSIIDFAMRERGRLHIPQWSHFKLPVAYPDAAFTPPYDLVVDEMLDADTAIHLHPTTLKPKIGFLFVANLDQRGVDLGRRSMPSNVHGALVRVHPHPAFFFLARI